MSFHKIMPTMTIFLAAGIMAISVILGLFSPQTAEIQVAEAKQAAGDYYIAREFLAQYPDAQGYVKKASRKSVVFYDYRGSRRLTLAIPLHRQGAALLSCDEVNNTQNIAIFAAEQEDEIVNKIQQNECFSGVEPAPLG